MRTSSAILAATFTLGFTTMARADDGRYSGASSTSFSPSNSFDAGNPAGVQRDAEPKRKRAWPRVVYGGNSMALSLPVQVPVSTTYEPRVRLGLSYGRQIHRRHWAEAGAAMLLDRGDWQTFRMDHCGKSQTSEAVCGRGGVRGFDVWAHYNYRFYVPKVPWLVPNAKLGLGGGAWRYPNINGIYQQARKNSWTMSLRPGMGLRVFPLENLGIGAEVSAQIGFVHHRGVELDEVMARALPEQAPERGANTDFLFGFEVLPLVIEGRF